MMPGFFFEQIVTISSSGLQSNIIGQYGFKLFAEATNLHDFAIHNSPPPPPYPLRLLNFNWKSQLITTLFILTSDIRVSKTNIDKVLQKMYIYLHDSLFAKLQRHYKRLTCNNITNTNTCHNNTTGTSARITLTHHI